MDSLPHPERSRRSSAWVVTWRQLLPDVDMIDRLKREAVRRALLYQGLIHTWLKERLDAETREPGR
jgi:hypothetical protein